MSAAGKSWNVLTDVGQSWFTDISPNGLMRWGVGIKKESRDGQQAKEYQDGNESCKGSFSRGTHESREKREVRERGNVLR